MQKSWKEKTYAVLDNATGKVVAIGGGLMVMAGNAMAAVPASVGTTFASVTTDATAIFDLIFPAIATVLGLVIIIKLFKRFGNKV